jgi:hypothetical protein
MEPVALFMSQFPSQSLQCRVAGDGIVRLPVLGDVRRGARNGKEAEKRFVKRGAASAAVKKERSVNVE